MNKLIASTVLGCAMVGLVGCESINKQDIGMVTGGVAGGLLGSQFGGGSGRLLAIGAGTLAGAYIGGSIGRNMDKTDQLKANQALDTAPTGQPTTWQNPDSGNRYTVTPVKTYTIERHQPCREYNMKAMVGGKKQNMYGTACRQADGSWKMKN